MILGVIPFKPILRFGFGTELIEVWQTPYTTGFGGSNVRRRVTSATGGSIDDLGQFIGDITLERSMG
jgi:hypothetical protein